MWKSLPIQTEGVSGREFSPIDRNFQYTRYPEVNVTEWKNVTRSLKQWFTQTWKDSFGTQRDPLHSSDLVGWIPNNGTIVARYGHWIGTTKSKNVAYINFLWVYPDARNEGVAKKLILSVANEICKIHGNDTTFMFEVDTVPESLNQRRAIPMCRYDFVWIPFCPSSVMWKRVSIKNIGAVPGFHGKLNKGFQLYQNDFGDKLLLDSNDDIVWYTSFLSIFTFNRLNKIGTYCRFFSPYGRCAIYAENMYFTPTFSTHYILG